MSTETQKRNDQNELRDELVRRVNELYHDLQSSEFEDVHRLRHRAEQEFWLRSVLPRIAELPDATGVDLCTGTGFVPLTLLPKLPLTARMTCIDISSKALNETRQKLGNLAERVQFHAGDVGEIPLHDASADWVTMNAALHHMPDPGKVLREVDRILKPAGLFCLGHEPNRRFFSSNVLVGVERAVWHSFWYLSPKQNLRRIKKRLGFEVSSYEQKEHLEEINQALLERELIDQPLTREELRKLVDVHTHSEEDDQSEAGFDAEQLIREAFPKYEVLALVQSDYGGEMMRKSMTLRRGFDASMQLFAPGCGRLISFIVQKPGPTSSCEGSAATEHAS